MEVSLTWDRDSGEDQYMVCASEAEWRAVLLQLNFIEGHWVAEALDLENQLNALGVEIA